MGTLADAGQGAAADLPSDDQGAAADLPSDDEVRREIQSRVDQVREKIAQAAKQSSRQPSDIRLLPVTKTVDAQRIKVVLDMGLHDLGENRVQELRAKSPDFEALGANWVLIGHLQTNKAAQAVRIVSEVQSVDSVRVANALNTAVTRIAGEGGDAPLPLRVLLQVNTSGEAAKYGLSPEEVAPALDHLLTLPNLAVAGFMTMAPFTDDEDVVRRTFARLRELRDELAVEYEGVELRELSMGMSHDYQIAVEEGATTVRVGSEIFGQRG